MAVSLGDAPNRLALNVVPFVAVFGLVWLAYSRSTSDMPGRQRVRDLALSAVTLACVVPAVLGGPPLPTSTRARIESDVLWSVTLQHPDHVIERRMVLPVSWRKPHANLRLVVRLDRAYDGPAELVAQVNGTELGSLGPGTSGGDPRLNRELVLDSALAAYLPVTTVTVRQTRPDSNLRIVTYGRSAGASLGRDAARLFDGAAWHRGVIHPRTGQIVDGLPHIVIQDLDDEIAP